MKGDGMTRTKLPVAVVGAGPIGLAAAAHLIERGETPIVLEAASEIAANVKNWAHVRMFSPWSFNIDLAARKLLEKNGWMAPNPDQMPTGEELIREYLSPLAQTPELKPHIRLASKVIAISRSRTDKMKDAGRDDASFVLHVKSSGRDENILARAVIDASGTWANPNPIGADGLFLSSEKRFQQRIFYGIPDLLGNAKSRYANRRVAVVGGGHSAINAILDLAKLGADAPETRIVWILRKPNISDAFGGQEADSLPARGELGTRIRELVSASAIQILTPFFIQALDSADGALKILGDSETGEDSVLVDEIIAATGSRPDLEMLRELRLSLDPSVESPTALAPLIDPNIHSCGTVPPHGERELRHPEKNFYVVGMKSYGRAPTFLLATGYEQVRSVVAALVGDWEAASRMSLVLPETGVCSAPGSDGENGCGCATTPTLQFARSRALT
jgi:thioredoxin reductase